MDKKILVRGVVFLGIGLSLIAFGVYLKIVMAGKIYGPLGSLRMLMWSAIVLGVIFLITGGTGLTKARGS